jgi:peptide/nickel transport system permease protein
VTLGSKGNGVALAAQPSPFGAGTPMTKYILRRVLISVPTLFGITIVIFVLADLMPGDAVTAMISVETPLSDELVAIRRGQLGLNEPLPMQYVRWVGQLLRGNMGHSYISGEPISQMIIGRIPASLELMGVSLVFSIVVGIVLGVVSALKQYSWIDYLLTILGFVGLSMPVFFVGMVIVYVFALRLDVFPTSGMATLGEPFSLADNVRHLFLPALSLGLFRTAIFMRYMRASVLDVLHDDYVRTARAKGLRESTIVLRHMLRNALIPVVTIIGHTLPVLLAGAVIVETMFQWPGTGLLYITAITQRDSPVIVGLTLVIAAMVLVSNLLTDIVYAMVDPRIRYS